MSVAEALRGRVDRSVHAFGPLVLQDLTPCEGRQVVGLAHEIINRQRQLTVRIVSLSFTYLSFICGSSGSAFQD